MRHAVFACGQGRPPELQRSRVTRWVDWNKAQDAWEKLDNRRRAGELPHLRFLEVRSSDDPMYNGLPYEPWVALPVEERPSYVKLSRPSRDALLAEGRREGNRDDAAHAMTDVLGSDPEWEHLPITVISDYAWAAANFCFPHESRY